MFILLLSLFYNSERLSSNQHHHHRRYPTSGRPNHGLNIQPGRRSSQSIHRSSQPGHRRSNNQPGNHLGKCVDQRTVESNGWRIVSIKLTVKHHNSNARCTCEHNNNSNRVNSKCDDRFTVEHNSWVTGGKLDDWVSAATVTGGSSLQYTLFL